MLALLSKELSFFWIGILYACRWFALNALEVPSGAIADQWGRRSCMIASFLSYIASFLCFALASNFTVLALAMLLFGVGDSFRTGTHKAMIFHWLRLGGREQERTKVYGLTRSWSKYGSAVSSVVAAVLLLITRDYRSVFLFSAVPCALNVINFLGYPAELEGESKPKNSQPGPGTESTGKSARHPLVAIKATWNAIASRPKLRTLLTESVSWEGVFHATKDYLQPLLMMFALTLWSGNPVSEPDLSLEAKGSARETVDPTAVLIISGVYALLHFLSARASRGAHLLVDRSGTAEIASGKIWFWTLAFYAAILLGSIGGVQLLVIAGFMCTAILQNVWRPILIGRLDEHSDSQFSATLLSVESQSQRIATMLLAPLIGLAIDAGSGQGISESAGAQALHPLESFWPIGMVGCVASAAVLWMRHKLPSNERQR